MQKNIVKVLEKGGVSEIKVQLLKNRHDERNNRRRIDEKADRLY